MSNLQGMVRQMLLDTLSCANCGIDYANCPNGELRFSDDTEVVRWRKVHEHTFCSDGCEAVYLEFVRENGWGE